jgi:hypothetical protein
MYLSEFTLRATVLIAFIFLFKTFIKWNTFLSIECKI